MLPYISGEEEKLESEYCKILGTLEGAGAGMAIAPASFPLTAMVHRVHVRDGHCLSVSLRLVKPATAEEVTAALRAWQPADERVRTLHSAPAAYLAVRDEPDRPQPLLDRGTGGGFTTTIGRVRACPLNTVKLFIVSHNTVMGAAGCSLLNAELAHAMGLLPPQTAAARAAAAAVAAAAAK